MVLRHYADACIVTPNHVPRARVNKPLERSCVGARRHLEKANANKCHSPAFGPPLSFMPPPSRYTPIPPSNALAAIATSQRLAAEGWPSGGRGGGRRQSCIFRETNLEVASVWPRALAPLTRGRGRGGTGGVRKRFARRTPCARGASTPPSPRLLPTTALPSGQH